MRTLVFLLTMTAAASAHEAPSGWTYDVECCHNQDCAVVQRQTVLPSGAIRVQTAHGTATFAKGFSIRASKDADAHACMRKDPSGGEMIPLCLYLPLNF